MPSSPAGRVALALFLAALGLLGTLLPYRVEPSHVWGDEGTFLAMTESLVEDGDLLFDERDRDRLAPRPPGASTVILSRSDGRIAYSKPVLYPVLAAPFHALFGPRGLVLLNALALAAALLLALAFLRRLGPSGHAALTLSTFVGAAVVVPYVFWRMSDVLQLALATAGLVLTLAPWRGRRPDDAGLLDRLLDHRVAGPLGALFLGLLVSLRLNNALVAAVPVAMALVAKESPARARARGAATVALVAVLGLGTVTVLTRATTGTLNPYRADRTSFSAETGYPAGPDRAEAEERFVASRATHVTGIEPAADVRWVAYGGLYFLVGRHTGFLVYFPAALALLVALRRRDRLALLSLAAFAGSVAFLVGWYPWNYFGGDTFIGNRYILPAYPLLLVALTRLPKKRVLAAAWVVAAVVYGSAWFSVVRTDGRDATSQSHAHAGIFRLLPYESITPDIAGRRDRYWADHFVRFVDPYARVGTWTFILSSDEPAAELQVAQWREPGPLRLVVRADTADAVLEVSDYRGTTCHPLGERANATRAVEIDPAPAWRRHRFWWEPETVYHARAFRLRLLSPEPTEAQIRYLGDAIEARIRPEFDPPVLLPDEPPRAGRRTSVLLRIRNAGSRAWTADGVSPVYAIARVRRAADDDRTPLPAWSSRRIPLDETVPSGAVLELPVNVDWPDATGSYVLEVDLVRTGVGWFAPRREGPLAQLEVGLVETR